MQVDPSGELGLEREEDEKRRGSEEEVERVQWNEKNDE